MKFSLKKTDPNSNARTGTLYTGHGEIETPVFMPVGTVGAVKTFAPEDLKDINSQIILGNTYHLYLRPGTPIIKRAGGLHSFISWDKPILTDSGGFQVFSLARLNKISDEGVAFQSHLDGSKHLFTPEISMKIQRDLGSDIIMAFDECPPGKSSLETVKNAVRRTTDWMSRCHKWLSKNPERYSHEQAIFPIIQGGTHHSLRLQSAEQLIPYSTIGMAIGGLAVGEEKEAMLDTVEYCDSILPKEQARYLMGVGKPSDILAAVNRGVDMFDCVMPTRNGRNGHIFTSKGVINIRNEKFKEDLGPIDTESSHPWGQKFSRSYVRHLFNINEVLGLRIASTLNLVYYHDLMKRIKNEIVKGNFNNWSKETLNKMKDMKGM